MITCYSCANSYAAPIDGEFLLLCNQNGDSVQVAEVTCLKYVREPGADEPEDIGE